VLGHFNPRHVAAHAGALFVIYADRVEIFPVAAGQAIGLQMLPRGAKWLRDRFFKAPDGWYALSFNGSTAEFEKVCDLKLVEDLKLIGAFDISGVDGPAYLTASGEVRLSVDSYLKPAALKVPFSAMAEPALISGPSEPATCSVQGEHLRLPGGMPGGPFRIAAIAADGKRIVLTPQATTARRSAAAYLLDLRTGQVRQCGQHPAMALVRNLLEPISIRNIRHKFNAIIHDGHHLTLVGTGTRSDCRIAYDGVSSRLVLQPTAGAADSKRIRFVPTPGPPVTGYRLSVAEWPDGSRAYLDSRGLLHLKSADAGIPELTLVLTDGPLAGWVAGGSTFGPPYFTGTDPSPSGGVYHFGILSNFVDRLI
jgi:hypothetical protein